MNAPSEESQELFDTADVIIAKGMGNYECMSPDHTQKYLFSSESQMFCSIAFSRT